MWHIIVMICCLLVRHAALISMGAEDICITLICYSRCLRRTCKTAQTNRDNSVERLIFEEMVEMGVRYRCWGHSDNPKRYFLWGKHFGANASVTWFKQLLYYLGTISIMDYCKQAVSGDCSGLFLKRLCRVFAIDCYFCYVMYIEIHQASSCCAVV